MSQKIDVSELQEGMCFSEPVFFDDGENLLLREGEPVSIRELTVLQDWNIPYVVTAGRVLAEGESVPSSTVEELAEFEELAAEELLDPEDDIVSTGELRTQDILKDICELLPRVCIDPHYHEEYVGFIQELNMLFAKMNAHTTLPARPADMLAKRLSELVRANTFGFVSLVLSYKIEGFRFAKSAVDTAIFSIIVAQHLGFSEKDIFDLVVASLLHDIGMQHVPADILKKSGRLHFQEQQAVDAHTIYAHSYIVNTLKYPNSVGLSVLQHHEHWNGKGYPQSLSGNKITIGARILAVTDAFAAMLAPKSYRKPFSGYQAMKSLLADNARRFDPDVIKAMIQSVGIYPIGSLVLLNNSAVARVVKTTATAPLRPCLRIVIDEHDVTHPDDSGEFIDLAVNKTNYIVGEVSPWSYAKAQ
ncbi:HD-GYP domain-containing protein [Treponema paraluiscuniculi]|uniref:HD-GYP domain-containing protein n=1 Tax=Treponema paraluiscuniculi TaxID=53435 RepID=A0ABY9E2D2_9SPIR|nr:HD-GYP domain-containing protein [Treponema paraluiscuniculi]WKC72765.1 hypothetical protein TPLL2_0912 [Treponema paraluiscuniculi]